jgi:hypothetical protein
MEAHLEAQELNKQGKYAEAAEKYAEMRRLDARALELTQRQGCPSCISLAAVSGDDVCAGTSHINELYEQLHIPQPWPAAVEHSSGSSCE